MRTVLTDAVNDRGNCSWNCDREDDRRVAQVGETQGQKNCEVADCNGPTPEKEVKRVRHCVHFGLPDHGSNDVQTLLGSQSVFIKGHNREVWSWKCLRS